MGELKEERKSKAQKRLKQLAADLSAHGLSNRELVKRMFPDLDPEDYRFQNAYTIFNKRKNGIGNYAIDEDYAMRICRAIRGNREIPSLQSTDIRWEWLAGYDDIKTYGEEGKAFTDYQYKRLLIMEEGPFRTIEYAANMMGLELLDKTGPGSEAAQEIHLIIPGKSGKPGKEDYILSRGELQSMENDLRTYASFLVSRLVEKKTHEKTHGKHKTIEK